jgi:integrase/recombinase XerD
MIKTIQDYIQTTKLNQNLSKHTLKAYKIDLYQLETFLEDKEIIRVEQIDKTHINEYIAYLKNTYKVKTVKRKLAIIKKFFQYLVMEDKINKNPFDYTRVKLKAESTLPKTIDFHDIKKIYNTVYSNYSKNSKNKLFYLTEVLMIELLYTTGIRVSELCNIKTSDINLKSKTILINGKGRRQRIVFIHSNETTSLIRLYMKLTQDSKNSTFLQNSALNPLSDQSVRLRIKRIMKEAKIDNPITPHMFRHTFATSLLEEEINLMYIQDLLGHSSLTTTQIYINVNKKKQQNLLSKKHPRKRILSSY